VVVNLSDIYAMNATPTQITVSIGFSNRFSVEALEDFYAGIYAACEQYQVDLIGIPGRFNRRRYHQLSKRICN